MSEKDGQAVCPICDVDDLYLLPEPHVMPLRTLLNGKYLIGRLLGSGGFSNTYLALDLNLRLKISIKEYLPRDFATRNPNQTEILVYSGERSTFFQQGKERFLEEAQTLARFNRHPGIVSITDFFHENNTAYIVMEYIEGITLKQYLNQKGGRLPLEQVIEIFGPVMDALRSVHEVGILHRDISPDNIYITRERQVKLLDFGAARQAVGEASKSLSVILKPGYAPEEQYRTRGKQGPRTDVYAVAASMYLCISGVLPPDALDRFDEDELCPLRELVPAVPKAVNDAVMKGLALRAGDRWQTIAELQQALKGDRVSTPKIENSREQVQIEDTKLSESKPYQSSNMFESSKKTDSSNLSEKKRSGWKAPLLAGFGLLIVIVVIATVIFTGLGTTNEVAPTRDNTSVSANPKDEPNVAIGNYVEFGKNDNKPIIWRVIDRDDRGNTLLFSDKILTFKAFDAGGDKYMFDRKSFGSNYYPDSNLRKWLNSNEAKITWKQNPPLASGIQGGKNPYEDEPGFLHTTNFSEKQRELILPRKHSVLLTEFDKSQADKGLEVHLFDAAPDSALQNYDDAYQQEVEDRVFLLSLKDYKRLVYDQRNILGTNFHLGQTVDSADYFRYWLNTPLGDVNHQVRIVDQDAQLINKSPNNGEVGVRPALMLNLDELREKIKGEGTKDKPFLIQK
jgi:serine/threonine protein kinase